MEEEVKEVVSMRQLLECGVHFGHQTKRWNPKMKKYIFTSRNGIHVIDLQQTLQLITVAYEFIKEVSKNNGTILFVGTKKQAQDAIRNESQRCEMPFVNTRWLGGTLTNISTIRKSINKLKDFERMQESGDLEALSKKEQSKKTKLYNKLNYNLFGIKNMIQTPSAIFIVDTHKEQLAIQEAKKLNIPIIGIVDTNANPKQVDYPIPANDDAIRAVKLICSIVADAVEHGKRLIVEKDQNQQEAAADKSASENVSNSNNSEVSKESEKKEKPTKASTAKKSEKVSTTKKSDSKVKSADKESKSPEKKSESKKTVVKEKESSEKEPSAPKPTKKDAVKKSK